MKIQLSIIIATRNRTEILKESVEKAIDAIQGTATEIIVVNDAEAPLDNPFGDQVIIVENKKRGVTRARNHGARLAKGDILFFIDDDMWINKEVIDWIANNLIVQKSHSDAVYNVNWQYPPQLNKKLSRSKIGEYILSSGYNTMWGRMKTQGNQPTSGISACNVIGSCSLIISRELFERVGGYHEEISFQGEDIELSNRLIQSGIPIFGLFDVTLYHNHADRLDLNGYLERIERGYESQFKAEKRGFLPSSMSGYSSFRIVYFRIASYAKAPLITLFALLPVSKITKPVINRLLGTLTAIIKYQKWTKVYTSA